LYFYPTTKQKSTLWVEPMKTLHFYTSET